MATERKSPDAIITQTNLTGALSAIQDDPDSPDGNWWTAPNNNADTVAHVSFPTPTGNPTVGADLQEFKVWVRKTPGQSGNPQITISLYENGGFLATLHGPSNVTTDTGELKSGTWNANLLGTANGSLVEAYIYGTKSGGGPSSRATVEVGAVEWNVTYDAGGTTSYQSIPATAIGLGVLATVSSFLRTLTATAIGSTALTNIKTFAKTLAGTALGIATLSRVNTFYRTLTATSISTSALTKKMYQSLTATATDLVVIAKAKMFTKTLAAVASGVSSLGYIKTLVKVLAVTVSGVAGLSRTATFYKTLASVATGLTTLLKPISYFRALPSTAIGSAFLSKVATFKKAISSTAIGVATLSVIKTFVKVITGVATGATILIADFIAGTGQTFYQALSAVAQAKVLLNFTPGRILSRLGIAFKSGLNLTTSFSTGLKLTPTLKSGLNLITTLKGK